MKKVQLQEEKCGRHAKPVSKAISNAIKKGTLNLDSEQSLDEFVQTLQDVQKEDMGRGAAVNILNINNGKNTIEFRVANGSINPDVWIENTKLYGKIVEMAEKLAQIEKKPEATRTPEEQKLLNLKESLKSQNLSEADKLIVLMDLLYTNEEDKQIFVERYEANLEAIKELEKNPDRKNPLKNLEYADVVDFRHKKGEFKDIAKRERAGNVQDAIYETRNGEKEENSREVM